MLSASQRPQTRRYQRRQVVWPVTIEADKRLLHGETVDVGAQGAKVRLADALKVGARATLHLTPTPGHPMAIEAIVWRVDNDGPAFFFLKAKPTLLEPQS